jgi:hypothetical protein
MSSPPAAERASSGTPQAAELDADVDAEMMDTQGPPTQNINGIASSKMDTDPPAQGTPPTSSGTNHNRKDATLREFLSKMDDYAPIVSLPLLVATEVV